MTAAGPPDAQAVAAAVAACPSVAALDGGRFGETVTYLPGRRVVGVAVGGGRIRISVIGTASATAASLQAEVSAAVRPLLGSAPVDLVFADIAIEPVPA